MKSYRRHRCSATHRTHRAAVRCMVPKAAWVMGEGPFAVIAWCSVATITLHATFTAAIEAMETIDGAGCGGSCNRRHELVWIDLEHMVTA